MKRKSAPLVFDQAIARCARDGAIRGILFPWVQATRRRNESKPSSRERTYCSRDGLRLEVHKFPAIHPNARSTSWMRREI